MHVKQIVFFGIIIASLFAMNSLVHSIFTLWQKNDLVTKAKQELEQKKKENHTLKQKLTVVTKPQFVEQEARDKLFLAKPGEGVIVIPTDYLRDSSIQNKKPQDSRPNWQQWWDTFF